MSIGVWGGRYLLRNIFFLCFWKYPNVTGLIFQRSWDRVCFACQSYPVTSNNGGAFTFHPAQVADVGSPGKSIMLDEIALWVSEGTKTRDSTLHPRLLAIHLSLKENLGGTYFFSTMFHTLDNLNWLLHILSESNFCRTPVKFCALWEFQAYNE